MITKKYILLFIISFSLAAAFAQSVVVVTGNKVRIRTAPSLNAAIATDRATGLPLYGYLGDSFPLQEELREWFGISCANGKTYYISKLYSQREEIPAQKVASQPEQSEQQKQLEQSEQQKQPQLSAVVSVTEPKVHASVIPAGHYSWTGRQGQYIAFELELIIDDNQQISGQIYYPESRKKNKVFHNEEQWAITGTMTNNGDHTVLMTLQEQSTSGTKTLYMTLEEGAKFRSGYTTDNQRRFELNSMLCTTEH